MTRLIDISPPIDDKIAVWPGDVGFSRDVALSMAKGDNLTLSSIRTTVHVGAHTDAPNHYARDGQGIAARPLERYFGPCEVMAVNVPRNTRIQPAHLPHAPKASRVLFRTGTYPDPQVFNEDFAALSPELIEHLVGHGVVLVGLDTPSVDLCDDRELLSHNAIARHDLAILEGVVLDHVEPGIYTLVALPLPLVGVDASPVRAVLRDDGGQLEDLRER
ncbi:MAG: cyclase family protein [Myxococcota bacterium]